MTLPAHRFRDRETRIVGDVGVPKTWVFDYDECITAAPDRLARIATALRALGDRVIVLTTNGLSRADLVKQLGDYGFPFDELIQYDNPASNGIARAEIMTRLDAWCGFDDRTGRAYTYAEVCPVLYLIAKPTATAADAQTSSRSELRSAAPPPPNLRVSDSVETDQPERECGTCLMFDNGKCWGYGNYPVDGGQVCDSWSLDPDWRQQDAAEDDE